MSIRWKKKNKGGIKKHRKRNLKNSKETSIKKTN